MLPRADLCLRTAAIGCRIQPSISNPPPPSTSFSTSSTTTQSKPLRKSTNTTHTHSSPSFHHHSATIQPQHASIRHSSSIQSAEPSTSGTGPAAFTLPADRLDWNTFFKLRKSRRRLQLGSSFGTSILGVAGGMQAIAMTDMDGIVGQIPLDPVISLGLMTFACGGLGWLVGPVVGTGIFNAMNRKHIVQMTTKEKEFYSRIKKFRVDPSASSMANPVPDYYGERISSVQGYRQWLKDQRAFNKKRQTFVN